VMWASIVSKFLLAFSYMLGETQSQVMHLIPALPVLVMCISCQWDTKDYYTVQYEELQGRL